MRFKCYFVTMSLSPCAEIVKEHDPDRFLLSAFMPADVHDDLCVLFALNHEIAKTREVVTETRLGQIRLKWWIDEIEKIYKGERVSGHEILDALSDVIQRRSLSYEHFETFIYAREFDLEDVQPGNIEGLLNYCDFTVAPLLKLVLQIMGDDPAHDIVQPVAVNYALIGVLRSIPFHAGQGRCYLPEDLLSRNDINPQGLYQEKPENIQNVVQVLAGQIVNGLRPDNKFLKASQILTEIYAKQLKARAYDPFDPRMSFDPGFKALRLAFQFYFL